MSADHDDFATPNCPDCLEPMSPVVGAWYCAACDVTVRAETTKNGPGATS